ncbi:hypothetical protein [Micromonospora sp. NBC_01796]|uniref:hypothetical protein n=1 Tax=Micromonospora sp. NBC_01796 TaxID=2975987 RepID=UPI002DD8DCB3|nr:hypothetical protein [Micromonospora sp. NBC_01796]WSA87922.1 hypothetical protein OIE47_10125 [Micromonospora sp. NBC_01796]
MSPLLGKIACPYCYHKIDGRRLSYQCNGRGSPGKKGCEPQHDADRERETGFSQQARLVFAPAGRGPFSPAQADCPKCGARSGIRACPCCHTPLSANFGAAASPLIAVVGATGTGKTVYLTVLQHELMNGLRRRFDADVRRVGGPAADVQQVFDDQTLFAGTRPATNGRQEPVVWEWRQQRTPSIGPRFRTTYLSFYDTAGEDLTKLDTTHDLTYLGAAEALILLLDPFMIRKARDQIRIPESALRSKELTIDVVNRVTETLRASHGLRSRQNIKIPVAVVFAKIDAFFDVLGRDHALLRKPPGGPGYDDLAGESTHEQIRALLHEWDADDIDTHLRFNYQAFRYFAVSALGAEPDYDGSTVDPRGAQPFRVDEPLVWLLSRFGVVPKLVKR